jgi:phospholipase C
VRKPAVLLSAALALLAAAAASADGDLRKVQHIVVVMQENHSFDNYFGALAYAPGSPYHQGSCNESDHHCVDGLTCTNDPAGGLFCLNSNVHADGSSVTAFHDTSRCVRPDLAHSWVQSHQQANFAAPNAALGHAKNDGFVRVNAASAQGDAAAGSSHPDATMGFYTQEDLPFYYDLAQKFAIDDRYFSSVLGPTMPNRAYLMAATSFGHVLNEGSANGYRPITGTIFDLLDAAQIAWADYYQDGPQGALFRPFNAATTDPHFVPLAVFLAQASGAPGAGVLPQVAFVDPSFGSATENDEHPSTDIQRGQAFVSSVVNAIRNGPYWQDSVIFITYDEHGGFYDHVAPAAAAQGGARTPDGIAPGQCADLSNPPASLAAGAGASCSLVPGADSSPLEASTLCPALAQQPGGPYPTDCASFDQLGFRVPFMAVSPFSKQHYVSHTVGDHASLLAFIEKRFLGATSSLTRRDEHASTLEDLFDFDGAPSLGTAVTTALPPADDCTGQP